jgi:hypothetical protein
VLSHIPSSVTTTENEVLCAVPDADEITEIDFNLKNKKAPGLDGVTAEMLQTRWEFMSPYALQLCSPFGGLANSQGSSLLLSSNSSIRVENALPSRIGDWSPS